MKELTTELFAKLMPDNKHPEEVVKAFVALASKYELNTLNRVSGFLAQCAHESNSFTVMKENLNYSAQGLRKVFSKYFPTEALANAYAKKPEKIASKVYANRYGNGAESTGDGYKYSGKGYIQLTFKSNYEAFGKAVDKSLEETIPYLQTVEGAMESAMWYWKSHKVNFYCDKNDIVGMTKVINGGTIGLDDRTKRYEALKKALA